MVELICFASVSVSGCLCFSVNSLSTPSTLWIITCSCLQCWQLSDFLTRNSDFSDTLSNFISKKWRCSAPLLVSVSLSPSSWSLSSVWMCVWAGSRMTLAAAVGVQLQWDISKTKNPFQGRGGPIPADTGQAAGQTPDRLPVHHRADTQGQNSFILTSTGDLESPINLT